jgi:transposase
VNLIAGYMKCQAKYQTLAGCIFHGNANTEFVIAWVEQCLVPVLEPELTVIWDNASIHKSPRIKELINNAGCALVFLPAYSPDFNPIEHFWAIVAIALSRGIAF